MRLFDLRIFLRNHCAPLAWTDLPAAVRAIFSSFDGSLAGADIYRAGTTRKGYRIDLRVDEAGHLQWIPAEIVVHQPNWRLVTLIDRASTKWPSALTYNVEAVQCGRFAAISPGAATGASVIRRSGRAE